MPLSFVHRRPLPKYMMSHTKTPKSSGFENSSRQHKMLHTNTKCLLPANVCQSNQVLFFLFKTCEWRWTELPWTQLFRFASSGLKTRNNYFSTSFVELEKLRQQKRSAFFNIQHWIYCNCRINSVGAWQYCITHRIIRPIFLGFVYPLVNQTQRVSETYLFLSTNEEKVGRHYCVAFDRKNFLSVSCSRYS